MAAAVSYLSDVKNMYQMAVLMAATAGAVFLGGAKILDCLRYERAEKEAAERPEA